MGFWLLVPGVGMGGGAGTAPVAEGIDYSLGALGVEFSLPRLHDFSEPNETPEFSL